MSTNLSITPLDLATRLAVGNVESLSELTNSTSLRPKILFDSKFKFLDSSIQSAFSQTSLSLFCAYYLRGVEQFVVVGDGITVRDMLNPLSTNPDYRASVNNARISLEGLMDYDKDLDAYGEVDLESIAPGDTSESLTEYFAGIDCLRDFDLESASAVEIDNNVSKPANLAVGKTIIVPLQVGDKKHKVSVQAMVNPEMLDTKFLKDILVFARKDQSFLGRLHRYRAGDIESWTDYVFMLDVAREERNLEVRDKDGMYRDLKKRKMAATTGKALTGKDHAGIGSSTVFLMEQTANELEITLRSKFSKFKHRERFFQETGTMLLFIIDAEEETFRLYTRGINDVGVFNFDDIKNNDTRANGIDLDAVFKAYQNSSMPRL